MKFKGYSDETLLAQLKGRFSVSYRIAADEQTALEMAKNICVEQTVEFPAAHIECNAIHSDIIGRLEQFEACEGGYRALISYSDQSATEEFAQFFNVVFGNSSLLPGITVASFGSALIAALVLGLVNMLVKPVLVLLTLPITIVTLGLFLIVINALLFWLVGSVLKGFQVNGFWWAVGGAFLYSIISGLLTKLIP